MNNPEPDLQERLRAMEQVAKVFVDHMALLGSEPEWRVDEIILAPGRNSGHIRLLAVGWPRLTIELLVDFNARVTLDPLTP